MGSKKAVEEWERMTWTERWTKLLEIGIEKDLARSFANKQFNDCPDWVRERVEATLVEV